MVADYRTYEAGGHAYHATMPTESLRVFRNVMRETESFGLQTAKDRQLELGRKVRSMLESHNIVSTAASGFQAPGVVVSYTQEDDIHNGKRFAAIGMQIAAGVPLMCDEPSFIQNLQAGPLRSGQTAKRRSHSCLSGVSPQSGVRTRHCLTDKVHWQMKCNHLPIA